MDTCLEKENYTQQEDDDEIHQEESDEIGNPEHCIAESHHELVFLQENQHKPGVMENSLESSHPHTPLSDPIPTATLVWLNIGTFIIAHSSQVIGLKLCTY